MFLLRCSMPQIVRRYNKFTGPSVSSSSSPSSSPSPSRAQPDVSHFLVDLFFSNLCFFLAYLFRICNVVNKSWDLILMSLFILFYFLGTTSRGDQKPKRGTDDARNRKYACNPLQLQDFAFLL